ncbi:hypothetical protein [Flavobacterium sp.]|uniref:hypothetical protein n=1 Tax=Flavobacterium sp. TaxID=239 RepID=UPI003751011F
MDRKDDDLYSDLKLLANKPINNIGTNENISILNIIKNFKNKKWFFDAVNQDPSIIRVVLDKFSSNYIDVLIVELSKIGYSLWEMDDYKQAIPFSLDSNDEDADENKFIDSRIAYWCGYLEKEKKYEAGFTIHQYDKTYYPILSTPKQLGVINPYSPLQVLQGDNTIFIPAFVAEYFTNEQLKEDKMIVLENISSMLLPEATLTKVKPFLKVKIPKIRFLKLKPSWLPERIISTKPNETVTLLGNYIKDTKKVITELDYPRSINFGAKEVEFNLLNVPQKLADESFDFFSEYNYPWLKEATNRGDDIVILSDKYDTSLLNKSSGELTSFGKEIQFMDDLVSKGIYKFVKEEGKYIKTKK